MIKKIINNIKNFKEKDLIKILILIVLTIFVVLVSFGLTGSSLTKLLTNDLPIYSDVNKLLFKDQDIRSDEWGVFTPMLIAQAKHNPPFPVTNKSIGIEGQNMLIVGSLGMPVHHISTIAKPSTWGMILFGIKQGLAWYWYFPFFSCFLLFTWLLSLIRPGNFLLAISISLLLVSSPYMIAWSGFTPYAIFGPTLAICCTLKILQNKEKNIYEYLLFSFLLGIGIINFCLYLYPPYFITLSYLYLLIFISILIIHKENYKIDIKRLLIIGTSIIFSIYILFLWYLDSKVAIDIMLQTEYPGKRVNLSGGGISYEIFLRGFSNIGSLFKIGSGVSNQSEAASFYYFLIPLGLAIIFNFKKFKSDVSIILFLIFYLIVALYFVSYGFPEPLSKLTLLNRVPSQRFDLAIGVCYFVLIYILFCNNDTIKDLNKKILSILFSVLWLIFVISSLEINGGQLLVGLTPGTKILLSVLIFFIGYFLIIGYKKYFLYGFALLHFCTLVFNPITIAPNDITFINQRIAEVLDHSKTRNKVLVLGEANNAMAFLTAGANVVNGTFYYPQFTFWEKLDPEKKLLSSYNRYQHFKIFTGDIDEPPYFKILVPVADTVILKLDPVNFDFRLLSSDIVASNKEFNKLSKNPSLAYLENIDHKDWKFYKVIN